MKPCGVLASTFNVTSALKFCPERPRYGRGRYLPFFCCFAPWCLHINMPSACKLFVSEVGNSLGASCIESCSLVCIKDSEHGMMVHVSCILSSFAEGTPSRNLCSGCTDESVRLTEYKRSSPSTTPSKRRPLGQSYAEEQ